TITILDSNQNVVCTLDTLLLCPVINPPNCCGDCDFGPELVYNGDFSAPNCNIGYASDLMYANCIQPGLLLNCGGYTEVADASAWQSNWQGIEHTANGGRALLVEGSCPGMPAKRAWLQYNIFQANATYCFSAWVKNVQNTTVSEPDLELRINGLNGTVIASVTDLAYADGWVQICGNFTPTQTGTIELDIVVQSKSLTGNVFMVDDISCRMISNCDNCCDNVHIEIVPDLLQLPQNGCTGRVDIWWDEDPNCDLSHLNVSGTWTMIGYDPITKKHSYYYQIPFGTSLPFTVFILDSNLNVVCNLDSLIDCIGPTRTSGCCGDCEYGPELVINGDFSAPACTTAYSSDCNYVNCDMSVLYLGSAGYTETTDANLWNSNWHGTDHSGNGSRALLIDGPWGSPSPLRVWSQSPTLEANATYCFSAWVKNVINSTQNEPEIDLRINGLNGTIVGTVGKVAFASGWVQICGSFTTSQAGPVELDVVVLSQGGANNDFMVDDISCKKVSNCITMNKMESNVEQLPELAIQLVPNPANYRVKADIQLLSLTPFQLEVVNAMGVVVLGYENAAPRLARTSVDLDLTGLSSGIYFMRLRQGGAMVVKSLMVER
ncbi:MAG TPA: T9SS type A sorting domain-containing protein, partial [Bacteroidetes bacterium]|nr:T9SS type A sorting domain-containing protein [Bacteroidota bacterium]